MNRGEYLGQEWSLYLRHITVISAISCIYKQDDPSWKTKEIH
uniref:Uncharacterized protein n=1 Tax=Setaria italica TaxID=4555 RepID=K4AN90_SETIT